MEISGGWGSYELFCAFLLATPLMAVIMVTVNMLYVENILGDHPDAPIPDGTSGSPSQPRT